MNLKEISFGSFKSLYNTSNQEKLMFSLVQMAPASQQFFRPSVYLAQPRPIVWIPAVHREKEYGSASLLFIYHVLKIVPEQNQRLICRFNGRREHKRIFLNMMYIIYTFYSMPCHAPTNSFHPCYRQFRPRPKSVAG